MIKPWYKKRAVVLYQAGYTIREVAERLDIGVGTVFNWLKAAGVETRPKPLVKLGQRGESHPAYKKLSYDN